MSLVKSVSVLLVLFAVFELQAQDHANAYSYGSYSVSRASHIQCDHEKILGINNLKCHVPDQERTLDLNLSLKAKSRIQRFCGSLTELNCEFQCVGYLSSPKDYGCSSNFAGGPISSSNCEDRLLFGDSVDKMKVISDKCADMASRENTPRQPRVVDDTRGNMPAVGIGGSPGFEPTVIDDVDPIVQPAGNGN